MFIWNIYEIKMIWFKRFLRLTADSAAYEISLAGKGCANLDPYICDQDPGLKRRLYFLQG